MNKNILKISTLVAIWAFCSQNATAQQGFGTNQPSKASVIEMKSGTKGLLIPRVALTGLNNFDPIKGELGTDAAKVNSLLVYNTATTTGITPGYYYWTTDGTTPNSYWKRLLAGDDAAALNLLGDVTGTLGATTVVKIQGRDVANTAPTSNQVLTWNGSAWTPTSLTPAQITDAQNVTAGSNKVTLGGTPLGASLQPFSIDVVEANLTLSNMGGKVTNDQITTGNAGQVLVTSTDGTTTSWIDQSVIAPTTTNDLTSAINSMTSNVNGVSSSASIINTNELSLNGDNHLVSTVNGFPSTALNLSAAVQAAETLTSITQDATSGVITYERERDLDQTANVVNSTTDNLISYDAGAFLNATTLQGAQKTTVVVSGDSKYATVSPNTPQGSNETTYEVTVKAAPRFFYMPAVVFNTDNQTTGTTTLTRDLYELYANQFNGTAHHIVQGANTAGTAAVETVNYTGGVVSSANATNALSSYLFTRGELEYHITYYDQTVFEIVGITEGGVLEYKIIGEATPMSYMNIVFVIK